ncbi:MAG: ribonuclease HI [Planctomycetota bacterium]
MAQGTVRVYTDGGCIGNPGPGGWGIRIRYPDGRFKEFGGAAESTTNNRMELVAVIEALSRTMKEKKVLVVMDSEYVRQGITSWLEGWKQRGWMTKSKKPVANQDLWMELDQQLRPGVSFAYTAGHAGDPDNERCDKIANGFARGEPVDLEEGVDRTPFARLHARDSKNRSSSGRSGPAVYLSYVHGRLMRHASWAECEKEVKGQSGALYKKCKSPEEERETLEKWGVNGVQES